MTRSTVCAVCHKKFKTAKAATRHRRDTHTATIPCTVCGKTFKSAAAAEQHHRDAHDGAPEFDPPYVAACGEWVWARDFAGWKSFGIFVCGKCDNVWRSAHAQAIYAQACRECEDRVYPTAMWVTADTVVSDDGTAVRPAGKPHHAHRCEACRAGRCSARR